MLMMLEVYDLGWMDGMLNTRAISMQGSDCVLPAWQVCCVVCCTEVEGWGVETVTGGRAGRETKFVGNKTAVYSRNRSSLCLLFVKLDLLCVFSSFIRSHRQEQGGSMPSTQAVAPSLNRNRDGSEKVRTFDEQTHRHKPFDCQKTRERLVVMPRSTA